MVKKSKSRARRERKAPVVDPSHISVPFSVLQDIHALASEALDGLRAMRRLLDSSSFKQIRVEGMAQLLVGPMGALDAAVDELGPYAVVYEVTAINLTAAGTPINQRSKS